MSPPFWFRGLPLTSGLWLPKITAISWDLSVCLVLRGSRGSLAGLGCFSSYLTLFRGWGDSCCPTVLSCLLLHLWCSMDLAQPLILFSAKVWECISTPHPGTIWACVSGLTAQALYPFMGAEFIWLALEAGGDLFISSPWLLSAFLF